MAAPTTTSGIAGGTTTLPQCANESFPDQLIPCPTPAPPGEPFVEKHLWKIILGSICLVLIISCAIMSYWKAKKKMVEVTERKERAKKRLEEKFKKELLERQRQMEIQALAAEREATALQSL